jgi:hypothetical protein
MAGATVIGRRDFSPRSRRPGMSPAARRLPPSRIPPRVSAGASANGVSHEGCLAHEFGTGPVRRTLGGGVRARAAAGMGHGASGGRSSRRRILRPRRDPQPDDGGRRCRAHPVLHHGGTSTLNGNAADLAREREASCDTPAPSSARPASRCSTTPTAGSQPSRSPIWPPTPWRRPPVTGQTACSSSMPPGSPVTRTTRRPPAQPSGPPPPHGCPCLHVPCPRRSPGGCAPTRPAVRRAAAKPPRPEHPGGPRQAAPGRPRARQPDLPGRGDLATTAAARRPRAPAPAAATARVR